jgi:hypothetical protein
MPNFTAARFSAFETALLVLVAASGCLLWPPTSHFVIHSPSTLIESRHSTLPSVSYLILVLPASEPQDSVQSLHDDSGIQVGHGQSSGFRRSLPWASSGPLGLKRRSQRFGNLGSSWSGLLMWGEGSNGLCLFLNTGTMLTHKIRDGPWSPLIGFGRGGHR